VRNAKRLLADVQFDTFVGTGMSGALAAPVLAYAMKKHCCLVRNRRDEARRSGGSQVEGVLGERWIFVDDDIATGATRTYVKKAIKDWACLNQGSASARHEAAFAGTFLYGSHYDWYDNAGRTDDPTWEPAEDEAPVTPPADLEADAAPYLPALDAIGGMSSAMFWVGMSYPDGSQEQSIVLMAALMGGKFT
jgi:hypothetical protein